MATKASKIILPPLYSVRDIIKLYRLRAIRELSQNFLLDSRVTDKIVRAAGNIKDGEVCEVGPGPGSITRSILRKNPSKLIVIEKDRRFQAPLEMLAEAVPCQMDIIFGDVLTFNMERIFNECNLRQWSENAPSIHLIGNLPFNVATPLIIRWLRAVSEKKNAWRYGRVAMTLTFQKEVAERIAAPILSPQRCRLSVMCQNWCHVEHKFNIPGKAFVPKPDVDVGVVHLVPLHTPVIDLPFEIVEKVTRCIFHFRQKYLIRGVETLFPISSQEVLAQEMCKLADIEQTLRPFQLTVPEFGRLCHAYCEIISKHPTLIRYNSREKQKDEFHLDLQ
ncbi:mitochondrial transcription factor B1 [Lycorma delicatula]|uniref:mitochondrial transcription factor B1 n=1 Tax=Lycorma delicatula TaxID=130591 RepID=UPI003F50FDF5